VNPADRALLTPTAQVTLDAVLEATGATLCSIGRAWVFLARPIVTARLEIDGSSDAAITEVLADLRRRGLLRALVRKPFFWSVPREEDPGVFVHTCCLEFRCATAMRYSVPR
jgi:hypothetical protein